MTWKEFKDTLEAQGLKDGDMLDSMIWVPPTSPKVAMNQANHHFVIIYDQFPGETMTAISNDQFVFGARFLS